MDDIHGSHSQSQDIFEPRYWTVTDPVDQPLCTYQKPSEQITCLSCFAKLVARSRERLAVSYSPPGRQAYWIFFDVDGNEAGWTPMCEHEDEPRREKVLGFVRGPC